MMTWIEVVQHTHQTSSDLTYDQPSTDTHKMWITGLVFCHRSNHTSRGQDRQEHQRPRGCEVVARLHGQSLMGVIEKAPDMSRCLGGAKPVRNAQGLWKLVCEQRCLGVLKVSFFMSYSMVLSYNMLLLWWCWRLRPSRFCDVASQSWCNGTSTRICTERDGRTLICWSMLVLLPPNDAGTSLRRCIQKHCQVVVLTWFEYGEGFQSHGGTPKGMIY